MEEVDLTGSITRIKTDDSYGSMSLDVGEWGETAAVLENLNNPHQDHDPPESTDHQVPESSFTKELLMVASTSHAIEPAPATSFVPMEADFDGADDGMDGGMELDPTKQLFLRRQPRRFAHTKTFSNGVADRATADWLKEHFQTKRGSLVPKGFLCDRYEEFCQTSGRKPMNNATLGRFIRGVFRGLETRRLGARQQSRYFYNNLGVRPSSNFVQLMMQEKRPSYIRRHRNIKPGEKASNEPEHPQVAPLKEVAPLVVPSYHLNHVTRRLETARLVCSDLQEKESLESILRRLDADGYQSLVEAAAQNEDWILAICKELDSDSHLWFAELTGDMKTGTRNHESDCCLMQFLSEFSCHLQELGSACVAVAILLLETSVPHLSDFVVSTYSKYYEKVLQILLPLQHSYDPLPTNDYVTAALHAIAVNFGPLLRSITVGFPEPLRTGMVRHSWAFASDLRERLNWTYAAAYVQQFAGNERLFALLRTVFCEVFDTCATADILFMLAGPIQGFEAGLQTFCQGGLENVADTWMKWFTAVAESCLDETSSSVSVKVEKLSGIQSSWVIFLALFLGHTPPFDGDNHIKQGVSDFLLGTVNRVINGLTDSLLGQTSLQGYAKKFFSIEREVPSPDTNRQWWPSFLQTAPDPVLSVAIVEPAAIELDPTQTEALVCDNMVNDAVCVKIEERAPSVTESSSAVLTASAVRVSGRAGKGRNRWLDECPDHRTW
ncbi:hypothetical protein BV898_16153 [Hypsibius exemplaris]|uniref:RFX-type winged-helix domain-containing protein n=1 Tax=Hypsibius exemplaris TaxID=2072580 RepID=A0A9X6RL76_HYPEX|nr:hypothetical protein BV898_16153 [Hypsibius exemplaris]